MLLLADIGNSETNLGLRAGDGSIARRWRIRTDVRRTPDEVGVLLRSLLSTGSPADIPAPTALCFASVTPPAEPAFVEGARSHLGIPVRRFAWSPVLGVDLDVDEPDRVGSDRVANVLAAHLVHPGPAIVVDLGTATNFDVVSAEGAFLGGAIAPGIGTASSTLTARTALLPKIAPAFPPSLIGKTTVSHMQIGVYHGAVAMIDGLVSGIRDEWDPSATVIATGGLATFVAPRCRTVDVIDPDLTLRGLGWGHDRLHPPEA